MRCNINIRTGMTAAFAAIALLCSTNGIAQTPTTSHDKHTVTITSDNTVSNLNATINKTSIKAIKKFNASTALIQVTATVHCSQTQNCPAPHPTPYVVTSVAQPIGLTSNLSSGFNYKIYVSGFLMLFPTSCGTYQGSQQGACSPCIGMSSGGLAGPYYTVCVANP